MGGRDATERPTYWRRDNVTNHSPSSGAIVLGITSAALVQGAVTLLCATSEEKSPNIWTKAEIAEIIQALTPIFLAVIGGAVGQAILFSPHTTGEGNEAKWAAGFGFAGTAISGAAGLAQSTRSKKDEQN